MSINTLRILCTTAYPVLVVATTSTIVVELLTMNLASILVWFQISHVPRGEEFKKDNFETFPQLLKMKPEPVEQKLIVSKSNLIVLLT